MYVLFETAQWDTDASIQLLRWIASPKTPGYRQSATIEITVEQLGGAMSRMPPSSAAWKHRSAKVLISIQSYVLHAPHSSSRNSLEYAEMLSYLKNWTDTLHAELHDHCSGAYANYAYDDLDNWEEEYYGKEIYSRLVRLKGQIPGSHIFGGKQSIRWAADESHDGFYIDLNELDYGQSEGPGVGVQEVYDDYDDDWDAEEYHTAPNLSDVLSGHDVDFRGSSEVGDNSSTDPSEGLEPSPVAAEIFQEPDVVKPSHRYTHGCPNWLMESTVPTVQEAGELEDNGQREEPSATVGGILPYSGLDAFLSAEMNSLTKESPSIRGKQFLVTGGTGGIGWSAVQHLARLGADVVFTSRRREGCLAAQQRMNSILNKYPGCGSVVCGLLDLESLRSVERFGFWVGNLSWANEGYERLDGIILNAGYGGSYDIATRAGNVSKSFAVNHLGHFLLVHLLVVRGVLNPVSGRIIVQSSFAARWVGSGHIESYMQVDPAPFDLPNPNAPYLASKQFQAYATGKAVNLLYAFELQRRLNEAASQIKVYIALPASTAVTNMTAVILENSFWAKDVQLITTAEAALPCVFVAAANGLPNLNEPAIYSSCVTIGKEYFPVLREGTTVGCHLWSKSLSLVNLTDSTQGNEMEEAMRRSCDSPAM